MNKIIGKKVEVYSLDELQSLPEGLKYFSCIGGSKNFESFVDSDQLSRAVFMEKYKNVLDDSHIPIYEDSEIMIRQDAQIAIPGFYIVATKSMYKNITKMNLELYQKCLKYVALLRQELKSNFNVHQAFMYYDEHYNKPSSTHFWVMPIYESVVRENNLNATILSNDIWKYQELFEFSKTKNEIYEMNDRMRLILK